MIVKLKIVPLNASTQTLTASYHENGKTHIVTQAGKYEVYNDDDKIPAAMQFHFDVGKLAHEIKYNADPKTQTEEDIKNMEAVLCFWINHPLLLINGKVHDRTLAGAFSFNLIDSSAQETEDYIETIGQHEVMKYVMEAPFAKLRDIYYYFNASPVGLTKGQMITGLVHKKKGMLFKDDIADGGQSTNLEKFIEAFLSQSARSVEMTTNIIKGIKLGIIEERPDGDRVSYSYKTRLMGSTVSQVAAFLSGNLNLYTEYLLVEIAHKDRGTEDLAKSEVEERYTRAFVMVANEDLTKKQMDVMKDNIKEALSQKGIKKTGYVDKLNGRQLIEMCFKTGQTQYLPTNEEQNVPAVVKATSRLRKESASVTHLNDTTAELAK